MYVLDLPRFDYKIQLRGQSYYIFDSIRKRYVRLTPEEWTRQHFIHYLIHYLGYPKSLISIERGISYNEKKHRPDIVVYEKSGKPLVLVECKASHIPLSKEVYYQLARYNVSLPAKLLIITNGKVHGCWQQQIACGGYALLQTIPDFNTLVG